MQSARQLKLAAAFFDGWVETSPQLGWLGKRASASKIRAAAVAVVLVEWILVSSAKKEAKDQAAKSRPWYVEVPLFFFTTLIVIALIQTFLVRMYMIPSQSMEPTLHGCTGCVGDRILVDKVTYRIHDPEPGDVVVFKGTDSWNTHYTSARSSNTFVRGLQNIGAMVGLVAPDENNLVKRIIAKGGQTVKCQPGDAGVMVDGQVINSNFIQDPPSYSVDPSTGSTACGGPYFGPITVPEGNYFMMGDNRTNSADSRYHLGDEYQGTIPRENIVGEVRAIVFPVGRMQLVKHQDLVTAGN